MFKTLPLINRDISWLSFNARVLQEASDPNVPLLERIKFLGIFSNNLDEFFRVRIGTYKRMIALGKDAHYYIGENPSKILLKIQEIVRTQQKEFDNAYNSILSELNKKGIFLVNENMISSSQKEFVRTFFKEKVRPLLVPIMLQYIQKFPNLKDKSIYLAVKMSVNKNSTKSAYALIEVPDALPRFLVLPERNKDVNRKDIILLDDVIRFGLAEIFSVTPYRYFKAYTIKLTRDAEIDLDMDLSKSLIEKISKGIRLRKIAEPVRILYDQEMPADLLKFLMKQMKLTRQQTILPGGRYHNFKDFIRFPQVSNDSNLLNPTQPPLEHAYLKKHKSMLTAIQKKDVLVSYPYQSFDYVIDFLREAAIDPSIHSIKITLYRAAKNSKVINALINAIRNGKSVTVVIELQARFDEQANINLANLLQEEGAQVIYGVPGLKVHSKLILVTQKINKATRHFAHIGTGNFNEETARIYSDFSLFTANTEICNEVSTLFEFFKNNFKAGNYKHLLVAPFYMRPRLLKLINEEIKNAKEGKTAIIKLKMNSLVDEELIRKLYQASEAGVKVKLIIRSICSLIPGIPGLSENIEAISLVDKYLEHARVFIFHNNGEPRYFISSADWMIRNLDFRTEVSCPIFDKEIQKELDSFFEIQWNGSTKIRILNKNQDNPYRQPSPGKMRTRAQDELYNFYKARLKNK